MESRIKQLREKRGLIQDILATEIRNNTTDVEQI